MINLLRKMLGVDFIENDLRLTRARVAELESKLREPCNSCLDLHTMIANEKREKEMLINRILDLTQPNRSESVPQSESEFQAMPTGRIPWHVRKEQLEKADRDRKKELEEMLRDQAASNSLKFPTLEEMETQLGVTNNG